MSNEIIKPPASSNNGLAPSLANVGAKIRVKCDGSCLKQDKVTFTHGKTVNSYIVYDINLWNDVDSSNPTLGNALFDAVKLTKNAGIDKFKFLGYGIWNILVLGKLCSINLTVHNKKFCLNLFYNGTTSYLSGKIYLANISKEFSVNNMKKTGFYGYV